MTKIKNPFAEANQHRATPPQYDASRLIFSPPTTIHHHTKRKQARKDTDPLADNLPRLTPQNPQEPGPSHSSRIPAHRRGGRGPLLGLHRLTCGR